MDGCVLIAITWIPTNGGLVNPAAEVGKIARAHGIEECFGWLKDIALLRKLKHRGLFKVAWIFTFAAAAYNLVRMRKLIPIRAAA